LAALAVVGYADADAAAFGTKGEFARRGAVAAFTAYTPVDNFRIASVHAA